MPPLEQKASAIGRRLIATASNFYNADTRQAMWATTSFFLNTFLDHPTSARAEFFDTAESVHSTHRQRSRFPRIQPEVKGSETLFVLGSGPSIGAMTEAQWEVVKSNDSWGFNQWFRHAHVPTMYVWQGFRKDHATEVAVKTLTARNGDYRNSVFTVRGDAFNRTDFASSRLGNALHESGARLHAFSELYFKSWCEMPAWHAIIEAHHCGFFDEEPNPLPVPKFGATAELLVSLAIRLRYQRIVLIGIDMLSSRHFWETPTDASEVRHPHLEKSRRRNTSVDYFTALALYARAYHGIELLNASRQSALTDVIPTFIFND